MRAIRAIIVLLLLAANPGLAQEKRPINASVINGARLPAVVGAPIDTERPGEVRVEIVLPFAGAASSGKADCPYEASSSDGRPRIRIRCTKILPQGYERLVVEAEFVGDDGQIGIPALRATDGVIYTEHGGQSGTMHVIRFVGVER
ncbi:MAG: hypothetical protein AB1744_02960 [Candidatus Zixiibacteriota bacterium]